MKRLARKLAINETLSSVYPFFNKKKKNFFIFFKRWVQWVQSLELLYTNTYSLVFVPYPLKRKGYNGYNKKISIDYQGLFKQNLKYHQKASNTNNLRGART